MNDPVDRIIVERGAMDRGLPGGVVLSLSGHGLLLGGVIFAALLAPKEPPLHIQEGFVVTLPPGGGGAPGPPAPQAPQPAKSEAPPPQPEPRPKVIKPPKEEKRTGLPELDAKKTKKRADKPAPEPASSVPSSGTGTSNPIPGLSFESGPGVPGGTDMNGDWYLAGVQNKIWMLWSPQLRAGNFQPLTVTFTIMADGSVTDVKVLTSSGFFNLDLAAQRAISSAGPFGPLPKNYGTDHYTVQAIFKPTT